MRILISNDDGIRAKGINRLALKLSEKHEVTVVAPSKEQSGTGHSLTFFTHLQPYSYFIAEGITAYELNGTPCDCVKFGIEVLMPEKPDLVISGINNERNLGTDCLYSGTVNAALEGSIMGCKSIAVSLACKDGYYEDACEFIFENAEKFVEILPGHESILNINIPHTRKEKLRGAVFTTTGKREYRDEYQYQEGKGYIITGHAVISENFEFADVVKTEEGYITVSPMKVDFNDYNLFNKLKDLKL